MGTPVRLLSRCVFLLAGHLAVCALLGAAGSFTIDQIMSAPFASDLIAAPKGDSVAWIENEQGKRNIWIASGPSWTARKLTSFNRDDGQEIADLAWAPDASYILFVRGGDFENGGENPNPDLMPLRPDQSLWRVDVAGGEPIKLTTGRSPQISSIDDVVFIRKNQIFLLSKSGSKPSKAEDEPLVDQKGSQSDIRWSSDGSSFAFVSDRGDHSFIGLYRMADKSLRYLDVSVDSDSDPVWSPDGRHLVFLRIPASSHRAFFSPQREGQPWSIRIADPQAGTGREVFRAEPGRGSLFHEIVARQQIFWTAAGRLVFPWERTGWCHLYSLAVAGGSPVELTPGEGEVEHVAASGDGKTIYYSTNIGDIDRRHLYEVSANGSEKPKPITADEDIEWAPTPTTNGSALAYLTSSYNERSHAAVRPVNGQTAGLYDARGRMVARLPAGQATMVGPPVAPPGFPAQALVKPQPVLITAADGLQIHGQLFLPPGDSAGVRHPALVFFHGGSRRQMLLGFHYMYYYSNAYSLNQYFANQGYVVLSVNYRSGIGYGLNFREAINYGARGGSEFNDVIGAGLYLKSRSDVDPSRIAVWGGSYGGYLTAMALSRASDLFAAGVDFHGVHDWSSLRGYLTRGELNGDPNEQRDRQEAARIAFESSPMASIDTWRSPVLLIHGDDDRNVEFSQTVMLVEALRRHQVSFEELIFPNEIHDFLLARHWVEAYKATAEFFARKLQQSSNQDNQALQKAAQPN